MAKKEYEIGLGVVFASGESVMVTAWLKEGRDQDRPLYTALTPKEAREEAARLIEAAEAAEATWAAVEATLPA